MTRRARGLLPRRPGRGGRCRLRHPRARRLEPRCGRRGGAHDGGRPAVQRRPRRGAEPRRRCGAGLGDHGRQRAARRGGGRGVAREESGRPGAPGDGQEPARAAGRSRRRGVRPGTGRGAGAEELLPHPRPHRRARRGAEGGGGQGQGSPQNPKGTVGAVALDRAGNLAAATSTGGPHQQARRARRGLADHRRRHLRQQPVMRGLGHR